MTTMTLDERPRLTGAGGPSPPIDPDHLADLEAALELLRAELALQGRVDEGGEDSLCEAVAAHCEGLTRALAEWEARVQRARLAPGALWTWLGAEAASMGMKEPPYLLGPLVDTLAMVTLQRARRWQLGGEHELALHCREDRFDGERHASVYLGDRMLARLEVTDEDRVAAAEGQLQRLFDAAQASAAAREVSDSRDALLALKQQLLEALAPEAIAAALAFAPRCPICAAGEAPAPREAS